MSKRPSLSFSPFSGGLKEIDVGFSRRIGAAGIPIVKVAVRASTKEQPADSDRFVEKLISVTTLAAAK